MTQINIPVAFELIRQLIHGADQYRADVIVTLCPMCQLNLDAYQTDVNHYFHTDYHLPVLYFTQLMGLAFGLAPEPLGLGKEFVDSRPALSRIGVELPPAEAVASEPGSAKPARKPKAPEGLPMPKMPNHQEEQP